MLRADTESGRRSRLEMMIGLQFLGLESRLSRTFLPETTVGRVRLSRTPRRPDAACTWVPASVAGSGNVVALAMEPERFVPNREIREPEPIDTLKVVALAPPVALTDAGVVCQTGPRPSHLH